MGTEKKQTLGEIIKSLEEKAPDEWSRYQAAASLAVRYRPSRPAVILSQGDPYRKEQDRRTAAEFLISQWAQEEILKTLEDLKKVAPEEWAQFDHAMNAVLTAGILSDVK